MKQSPSSRRVNEQLREVVSSIILFEMSDPRLERVTITGCEVSFDRSVANVFYTTGKSEYVACADALQRSAGRIRSLVARRLSWRVSPELRFILDSTVDQAERIGAVLAQEARRTSGNIENSEDQA